MVFAGDELGFEGVDGEDSRRTMPWQDRDAFGTPTRDVYATLSAVRRQHPALRRGSLRWAHVSTDSVAFLREHPDGSVLVCVSRAGANLLDPHDVPLGELALGRQLFSVGAADEPRATIWTVS